MSVLSIIYYQLFCVIRIRGTKNFFIRPFCISGGEIRKEQKREVEELLLKTGPPAHYLIVLMPHVCNLDMNYHKYIHT